MAVRCRCHEAGSGLPRKNQHEAGSGLPRKNQNQSRQTTPQQGTRKEENGMVPVLPKGTLYQQAPPHPHSLPRVSTRQQNAGTAICARPQRAGSYTPLANTTRKRWVTGHNITPPGMGNHAQPQAARKCVVTSVSRIKRQPPQPSPGKTHFPTTPPAKAENGHTPLHTQAAQPGTQP